MSVAILFKIIAFISLLYSFIKYMKTRKYIYKLPKMTREKYLGLDKLARRILFISTVLFTISLIKVSGLISIISSCVIMYMLAIMVSELNVLKEYINLKKKMK